MPLHVSQPTTSARELEIVLLAAEGLTDKEIAVQLGLSAGTVRTYWLRMRKKLNAANRAQIISKTTHQMYLDSEAKRSVAELQFTLMVETLRDFAIFSINEKGLITSWNPGVKYILGYSEEEFIGLPFSLIFTEEDQKAGIHEQELAKAIDKGRAEDKRWHRRQDGKTFYASGTLVAIRDALGNLQGCAKIIQDQTALKLAADRAEELELKLARMKGHS